MSNQPWPADSNIGFVEEMYARYLESPKSVSAEWRRFFEESATTPTSGNDDGNGSVATTWVRAPSFRPRSIFNPGAPVAGETAG